MWVFLARPAGNLIIEPDGPLGRLPKPKIEVDDGFLTEAVALLANYLAGRVRITDFATRLELIRLSQSVSGRVLATVER